nr:S1/P1 nuclease [Pseudorhodoferax soli]
MLCSALLPSTANAWGQRGHRLIAELAQTQLTPKARLEVARLLAPEPGATLASISTWADEQRSPATAAWHYVNFPRTSCSYDAARDCAGGRCVVGALEQQLRILQSAPGDEARFLALKYVVHLAGDVHQPLHAGFADDRGGNSYQLQAFGKGTNLHALWDSGLLHNRVEDSSATLARLAQIGVPRAKRRVSVVQAAEESCGITSRPDFYPTRTLDDEYAIRFTPIMERQLALAGARLAELLNDALR